jgi:hypothetical protein
VSGIIWLASYPKSGNTWLRAFLANLFQNPEQPLPINELPNYVLGDNFLLHYEQFTGRPADQLSDEDFERLRPQIHEWFAFSKSDSVFVKTHNVCGAIEGRPLITPSATAGAIYVVRNPLDVAVSYANHYQVSLDRAAELLCDDKHLVPRAPDQLAQYLMSWSSHVKSWTEAKGMRRHVMRYEDMHEHPLKAFGGLARFLGLPKDLPRLKKAVRFSSFRELKAQEESRGFVEARPDGTTRFFRSGKAGTWRESLSPEQVERIIAANREVMERFGYLDETGTPVD